MDELIDTVMRQGMVGYVLMLIGPAVVVKAVIVLVVGSL